jgi:hypothetical protein
VRARFLHPTGGGRWDRRASLRGASGELSWETWLPPVEPSRHYDLRRREQRRIEFSDTRIPQTFGRPNFLFASSISTHSARPFETIEPLAKGLGLPIDATFADQDHGAVAHELLSNQRYANSLVLVCWHHGNIPPLASDLGAAAGQSPNPWDPLVFNLVLRLDYRSGGGPHATLITEPF